MNRILSYLRPSKSDMSTAHQTTTQVHEDELDPGKQVEGELSQESLGVSDEAVMKAFETLVAKSAEHTDVTQGIHAHASALHGVGWLHDMIPGLEKLAAYYHIGNWVAIRGTDKKFFESMPIYARIGMHLLFYGREQLELLHTQTVEELLRNQSIKQGTIYDSPESTKSIPSFIKTYNLQMDELLEPDIKSYKTFNEFFSRRLKPDARPVASPKDPAAFSSAADCRLTVYQTVDLARQFWIKSRRFTVPLLLDVAPDSKAALDFDGSSLAIFRLAPADYHRFHSPLDCVVGEVHHVPGQYYTVNPQAVNYPGFDVFTSNTRSILYLKHVATGLPVAFVAIGALLVGSIGWSVKQGEEVKRGQELGWFAYGGSTVVVAFPRGLIEFDEDLVATSKKTLETQVKVGWSLGKTPLAEVPPAKK